MSTLLEDVLEVMPKNMDDFSESHHSKIEELLKLDSGDIPIGQVKFSPRHRQSAGQASSPVNQNLTAPLINGYTSIYDKGFTFTNSYR